MALFQVPGWDVPSSAWVDADPSSKKRKRGSDSTDDKLQTAHINLDKLVEKLGDGPKQSKRKKDSNLLGKRKKNSTVAAKPISKNPPSKVDDGEKSAKNRKKGKKIRSGGDNQEKPKADTPQIAEVTPEYPQKQPGSNKKKHAKDQKNFSDGSANVADLSSSTGASSSASGTSAPATEASQTLTPLQKTMKNSLEGARFRWINELLYKSDSAEAHQMMKQDPTVFAEYHAGFRHQVQSWPTNPVEHYISKLSSYPSRTVVADLGCGDAALARSLLPKGLVVLSYDLVSDGKYVIEADTSTRLPLPGSDEDDIDDVDTSGKDGAQIVDIVVCALSLMGTNWVKCIMETWRVLRPGGELLIAEVASRFTDMDAFCSIIGSVGFRLMSKDERNTHFTLFEFKKVTRKKKISEKEWKKLVERGSVLKPCEYKRR